jgi:hypothetical protein
MVVIMFHQTQQCFHMELGSIIQTSMGVNKGKISEFIGAMLLSKTTCIKGNYEGVGEHAYQSVSTCGLILKLVIKYFI